MKRGSIVIGAIALAGVGALGILEVTAAPQSQRNARNQTSNNQGRHALVQKETQPADEGGVAGGSTNPDITVSRLGLNSSGSGDDFHYYGESGGIRGFAMASTSCNVGNQTAEWINGGRNPVIAQNLYRYYDGKFEQIGMSWVKHSFCAVSEPTCGSCSGTPCSSLGIGCADTYWSELNGEYGGIGPRWNKNPQGQGPQGVHNDVYQNPVGPSNIRGRLQIHDTDIIAGAQYVAEIQYVTHDEPLNRRGNNASHRLVNVSTTSISGVGVGQASVAQGKPGIIAWTGFDPAVKVTTGDDLSPAGQFNLATRVYDNGDGTWDYEYALHNMNSHRGAGSFGVPVSAGLEITNVGFHDVDYHSGDGVNYVTQDGTDWAADVDGSDFLVWQTQTYAENQNANALRWGTLYNYRFTANAPPVSGTITVGLFRPATGGQPESITIGASVPDEVILELCPADMVSNGTFTPPGDGTVDGADLGYILANWGPNPGSPADIVDNVTFMPPGDGTVDGADLGYVLTNWGACE